jgi:hypothetical protein
MAKTKAAKTKAAKTPAKPTRAAAPARAKKVVARAKKIVPPEELDATEVLTRLVMLARSEEEPGEELPALVERLQATADASLVRTLFGALDDDDPHGVLWSIFYVLEGLEDAYLEGLLEALPDLLERAPVWAETAVLRIVNTKDEPDDCIDAFVTLARAQKAAARKRTIATLVRMGKSSDGLHPSQRKTLAAMGKAIEKA